MYFGDFVRYFIEKNLIIFQDNTWWYGNLASDKHCTYKLQKFLLPNLNCNSSVFYENILNRFVSY